MQPAKILVRASAAPSLGAAAAASRAAASSAADTSGFFRRPTGFFGGPAPIFDARSDRNAFFELAVRSR